MALTTTRISGTLTATAQTLIRTGANANETLTIRVKNGSGTDAIFEAWAGGTSAQHRIIPPTTIIVAGGMIIFKVQIGNAETVHIESDQSSCTWNASVVGI